MLRVTQEPAYVLHVRPYRETSLLVEAFVRGHGRQGLVARGARSPKSQWKNVLQPFRPLLISWTQRGELGNLTGAEQVASPPPIEGLALFCGLYANELLMRTVQRADAHPELFESYRQLLSDLAAQQASEPALRVFEKQLLDALGFGLQLELEHGSGKPVLANAYYAWVPEHGLVRREPQSVAERENSVSPLVSGAALLALQSSRVPDQHLPELKQLMRRVLRHYLGDKPLQSHALFQ